MAKITLEDIKSLRERTGVGIHQVKAALEKADGNIENAIIYLREQGIAKAAKRSANETNNGIIGQYTHGKSLSVLVDILSETDFASNSDKFQELAKELAMHIAAKSPEYIDVESVPLEVIEAEKRVYAKELEGKPEAIKEKILVGKMAKFFEDTVLMEQTYVRDEDKKIKDLLNEYIAALGESIRVNGFVRLNLGNAPIVVTKS